MCEGLNNSDKKRLLPKNPLNGQIAKYDANLKRWIAADDGGGSTLFNGNRPIKRLPTIGLVGGGATLNEWIENVFFPSIDASILLTNASTILYERGETNPINLPNKNLIASIVANDSVQIQYRLFNVTTNTPVGAYANIPSNVFTVNVDVQTNIDVDYAIDITFITNGVNKTSRSPVRPFRWIYPFYYGMAGANFVEPYTNTSLVAEGLTKVVGSIANQLQLNLNGTNKMIYLLYPSTKGPITSIFDNNGFNITNAFQYLLVNVAGDNPNYPAQQYRLYFSNVTTVNNSLFTFNF